MPLYHFHQQISTTITAKHHQSTRCLLPFFPAPLRTPPTPGFFFLLSLFYCASLCLSLKPLAFSSPPANGFVKTQPERTQKGLRFQGKLASA